MMDRPQFELLLVHLTGIERALQRLAYATERSLLNTVLASRPCRQCGSFLVRSGRLCGACGAEPLESEEGDVEGTPAQ